MALTLSTAARASMADALLADIDAGTGAILRIYNSGEANTLVDIALDTTASFTQSGGVLTMDNTPNPEGTAIFTDTAATASILTQDGGTVVISGLTVSTSGADVNLSSTAIVSGGTVSLTSGTITVPAS